MTKGASLWAYCDSCTVHPPSLPVPPLPTIGRQLTVLQLSGSKTTIISLAFAHNPPTFLPGNKTFSKFPYSLEGLNLPKQKRGLTPGHCVPLPVGLSRAFKKKFTNNTSLPLPCFTQLAKSLLGLSLPANPVADMLITGGSLLLVNQF